MRGKISTFDGVAGVMLAVALLALAMTTQFPTAFQFAAREKIELIATAVDAATGRSNFARQIDEKIPDIWDFGGIKETVLAKRRNLELTWTFLEGCWEASPTVYGKLGNRHITCFRARERVNVVYLHYANRGYRPAPTDCSYSSKVRLVSKTRMILEANMDRLGACSNENAAGRRIGYAVELVAPDRLVDHTLTRIFLADGLIEVGESVTYERLPQKEVEVRQWFQRVPKLRPPTS